MEPAGPARPDQDAGQVDMALPVSSSAPDVLDHVVASRRMGAGGPVSTPRQEQQLPPPQQHHEKRQQQQSVPESAAPALGPELSFALAREPSLGRMAGLPSPSRPGAGGAAAAAAAMAAAQAAERHERTAQDWHDFLRDCALEPPVEPTLLPPCLAAAALGARAWLVAAPSLDPGDGAAGSGREARLVPRSPLGQAGAATGSVSTARAWRAGPPARRPWPCSLRPKDDAAGGCLGPLVEALARVLEIIFPRGCRWLLLLSAAIAWGVAKQLWHAGAVRELRALRRFLLVMASGL